MSVFAYTKLNNTGGRDQGTIEASTLSDARRKLRMAGVHVIEITDAYPLTDRQFNGKSITAGVHRIKQRELTTATWQLSALLHAGIPLVPALSALTEQLSEQTLVKVFTQIRDKVNEGRSFANALEEYPVVFSEIYVSLVRAGEATGTLENVLSRIAQMSEKRDNLISKVKSVMVYPLFMAIVGTAVVVFIFTFIIPSITKLFLEMKRQLPWPTVMLMNISSFLQNNFWIIMVVMAILVTALVVTFRSAAGKTIWDKYVLKCPLFGNVILKISIARFSRTLAVLLASGLTIVEALDLGKKVVGNIVLSEAIENAKDAISRGQGIAQSFRKKEIFPPIVIHVISAGEKSGNIEEGLANVADIFENEVESAAKALTSLLEPVMIILLGIIVGFIVLSILLPIFDINQAVV
jgi:general secretion pathway protein F